MVGGTTSSVQSMVLTACKRGDEIILPRHVHRSVLNALVPVSYTHLDVYKRQHWLQGCNSKGGE